MDPQASFAEYVRRKTMFLCFLVVGECLAFTVVFAFSSTNPMYLMEENKYMAVHGSFRLFAALAATLGLVGMLLLTKHLLEFISSSDRFIELERLATLGKFSAWAAHQIRNPLAVIRGQVQLLSMKSGDESLQKAYTLVMRQCDKTSDLISLMMALSQPVLIHHETVGIPEVVSDILPLYSESHPRVAFSHRSLARGEVSGHRGLVEEALKNLLTNAVESFDGGEGHVEIVCSETDDSVSVEICDSGPGFSDKALECLFEIGFTTKKMGNGLGLPIVKAIMNAHKGSVQIERRQGPKTSASTIVTLVFPKGGRGVA